MKLSFQIKSLLFTILIFGLCGVLMESYFTGFESAIKSIIQNGFVYTFYHIDEVGKFQSGLITFIVYSFGALPYILFCDKLQELTMKLIPTYKTLRYIIRGLIFGITFMFIEMIIGLLYLRILGHVPWNYSNYPLNIMGITTFAFLPLWALAGIFGEYLREKLLQIDDIVIDMDIPE